MHITFATAVKEEGLEVSLYQSRFDWSLPLVLSSKVRSLPLVLSSKVRLLPLMVFFSLFVCKFQNSDS